MMNNGKTLTWKEITLSAEREDRGATANGQSSVESWERIILQKLVYGT